LSIRRYTPSKAIYLPVLLFLAGVTAIVVAWSSMQGQAAERLQLETQVTAEHMKIRLENWVDDRIAVIYHISDNHDFPADVNGPEFREIATEFMGHYSGFQAINFVDTEGRIAIVVPEEGNLPALGINLMEHPSEDVHLSFERARTSRSMTRTHTIQLLQGGSGFALYCPVIGSETKTIIGYINGVFRIETLLDDCFAETRLRDRFAFTLTEPGGFESYAHDPDRDRSTGAPTSMQAVRFVDKPQTLMVWPRHSLVAAHGNSLYGYLSAGSVLLVLFMCILLRVNLIRQSHLDRSRANYKLLIDNQAEFVVKTTGEGQCIFVSPSFCRTTGRTEDDLIGSDFFALVHGDDRQICTGALVDLLKPPHMRYLEIRTLTDSGWRWCLWSASAVLGADGSMASVVFVGRDITSQRSLEEQLRQSQKMQAVGHLAGGIAHDFNNILQSIMGSLELAQLDVEQESQVHHDILEAYQSAERAAGLTRQLLAFSRYQVLQLYHLSLDGIVDGMRSLITRSVGDDIPLSFDLACGDRVIFADDSQIQQVLLNLAVNARDAVRQAQQNQGGIRIRTEPHHLDADFCRDNSWASEGDYLLLEVEDDGIGMDEETLSKIFEPFFSTKRSDGGTGLGLATVYSIVDQHDGLIHVSSAPGCGTTVKIFLKLSQGEAVTPREQDLGVVTGGCETILLAEDDDSVRAFAVRVLEGAGYNVLVAEDGEQALALFEQDAETINFALLDIIMPRLNGREVHDAIQAVRPDLPVLFCSGYGGESIHTHFILDEGLELLPKPYTRSSLLVRIRSLLDNRVIASN